MDNIEEDIKALQLDSSEDSVMTNAEHGQPVEVNPHRIDGVADGSVMSEERELVDVENPDNMEDGLREEANANLGPAHVHSEVEIDRKRHLNVVFIGHVGAVRGLGWQKIGAIINLGSYYLVGIPSAVLMGFVLHIGGKGLWLGIICALLVQVLSLLFLNLRANWEQEAQKAQERVEETTLPVEAVY